MKENWIWLGHKQHFICARYCEFNMATLLPNGYLISTIGEYYSPLNNEKMEEIGSGRFFETYVFKTVFDKFRECGCPIILSHIEIDSCGYNTAKEAQIGHIKMCEKFGGK